MGYGRIVRQVIGERLSALRLRKGLTQKQLAEALGVSAAFVNKIESGAKAVPDAHMDVLMATLDVSAADLMLPGKMEMSTQELAFKEIAELFHGAGVDEAGLAMELVHYFLKGSPSARLKLLKFWQDQLLDKDVILIDQMQLINRIKTYIRENSTQKSEPDDEMYG
jgi:transcriptional regulator with XRE-family HTH domain